MALRAARSEQKPPLSLYIVCLAGFVLLYWQAQKRGHIMSPF